MGDIGLLRKMMLGAIAAAALVLPAGAGAAVAHPDLSYDLGSPPADAGDNALDVYVPEGAAAADSRPVVVYVHGGGWRAGDKGNQIARKVNLFTGAGYVFVSLNYRLSPADPTILDPARIRFPDHPHDVGEALGWLSQHIDEYGGDPTRLALVGHSAGAHLIALISTDPSYAGAFGVEPWQIIGTVPLDSDAYVVEDRIDELPAPGRATYYNAFGTPDENAVTGSWAAASPQTWADAGDPRFLLVTQDNPRRLADNQAMAGALGQDPAGVIATPYTHEQINEMVGGPGDTAGETQAIMDFIAASVAASADPVAKLAKHPRKRLRSDARRERATFKLTSKSPEAVFECRVDSRRLKPCKARKTLRVGRGRHTFRYRALSASGRPGETEAFRFRVVGAG
ncbi:MAG: alpha/beta hydrolase [Solirubrobacterales bacterium]